MTSTACSTCSWLSTEVDDSSVTLFARNWNTFWYWRKVKLRSAKLDLEHVEVGVERARVDAVDGERALEAPQGRRHAAQGRARHIVLDALGDDIVEQPSDEILHAEREPSASKRGSL